ncbi:cell surface protein [Phenylobacterium sp.]|uniref:cell surface protein n=1 Tax=Phenylobacterium sp. TaxID=1871053 RepID=UPI0025EB03DE|nr:cell surface protein [Phenylobacterium sp.]
MRHIALLTAAGLALALSACSKADQAKTDADVHAAASDVAQAGHEVATSPVVQKAGESLKDAAHDTGTVLKETAKGAVSGAKAGYAEAKGDHPSDDSTTTTTTTTTVEKKTH